jgi:hypothetical protein
VNENHKIMLEIQSKTDFDHIRFEAVAAQIWPVHLWPLRQRAGFSTDFATHFLFWKKAEKDVARVIIYDNPKISRLGKKTMLFGAFECVPDTEIAVDFLKNALDFAQKIGTEIVIGPMDGSTWNNYRFTLPSENPPFLLEPLNLPHYPKQWESAGFLPFETFFSQKGLISEANFEKLDNLLERCERRGLCFRSFDLNRARLELEKLADFNEAVFRNASFFTSISTADFVKKYEPILPIIDPDFVQMAETEDGKLVGLVFALPDLFDSTRKTAIIKTLARLPGPEFEGLGGVLTLLLYQKLRKKGFTHIIHALMREGNRSVNLSDSFEAGAFRQYQLFEFIF